MVINIVSGFKGGGAELLVRELHKRYLAKGVDSHAVYLEGYSDQLGLNEQVLGVNPRSPSNILRIRALLKSFLVRSESELLVHVHLTWPFFYVVLASIGLNNLKLVYTEHNTWNKRRKIPLWRYFERFVYARYSKIICISAGVYESLVPWVGSRLQNQLVTIPNGARMYSMVDRLPLGQRKPGLISIGSLTSKKNFSTALLAVAEIRDQVESYIIIGEGPARPRLEQLIREHDLQKTVTLLGWSDKIEYYLEISDLQVIPSLWEGFGLVAIEGMSTGLSIVASNVAGLRDVVGQHNPAVTLVDNVKDVRAWANSLQNAIEKLRIEDAGEMALASSKQVEKFTLDVMAERYLDVYNSF
jgi:glycosyltransferase involved in cell wall biosynthesis